MYRRRSRSKDREHEKSRRQNTFSERRLSKSPDRSEKKSTLPEVIKPAMKTETELKEEAAIAAMLAKVRKS